MIPFKEKLLKTIPFVLQGSEKYEKEDTIKYITLILAYNQLPEVHKEIKYDTLMKPLDKDKTSKSKFYPLSSQELLGCKTEADQLANAIEYLDAADRYEKTNSERKRIEKEQLEKTQKEELEKQEIDALDFLSNNPLEEIKKEYYKLHKGDDDALSTTLWAYCYKWVRDANDEGIHIIAVGSRGTGKSHGIMSAMKFLPPELTLLQGISARYLYYAKNLIRGMSVYIDELPTDQALIDSLKAIITAYPVGGKRGVVISQEAVEQEIPPRITINTSSVDQTGDEQFTNRMTVIRANDDIEKKTARVEFRIGLYEGEVEYVDQQKLERIHNALRYIALQSFIVKLPKGALHCDNYHKIDMRVFNQCVGAMCGNAILNFPNRNPVYHDDGCIEIYVSKKDFDSIIHMYKDPDEYYLKLTPAASLIKNYLEAQHPLYKSIGTIAEALDISAQTVRNTLLGRKDRNIESLVSAGYVEEIMISAQERDEYSPRLSTKVYRSTRGKQDESTKSYSGKKKEDADSNQKSFAEIVHMLRWEEPNGASTEYLDFNKPSKP